MTSYRRAADAETDVKMMRWMYWIMTVMAVVVVTFGDSRLVWHAGNIILLHTSTSNLGLPHRHMNLSI